MDNKKIDEIDKKLNLNSSEIESRKSQNWSQKHSFWMIHAINLVLSSVIGLIFGLIKMKDPYNAPNFLMAPWIVLSINIVNGIITILPQKKYFNLNRMVRIGIVILNFIVSFASFIGYYIFIIGIKIFNTTT